VLGDDGAAPVDEAPGPDQSFGDDTDTVPECTGECCDPVTMSVELYREMSLDPRGIRNARYVLSMLKARAALPAHGTAEFDCKYFDRDTRRCTAYDRRPEMCRTFPDGPVCHMCGGRFATGEHPDVPAGQALSHAQQGRLAATWALVAGDQPDSPKSRRRRGRR
jgi:Fe-S-cluster containining protein